VSADALPFALGHDGSGHTVAVMVPFGPSDGSALNILRYEGSGWAEIPTTKGLDLSDFAENFCNTLAFDVGQTVVIGASRVYFVGLRGVTVVPLDGSAPFFTEHPDSPVVLGGFGLADGDDLYLTMGPTVHSSSSSLQRVHPDGTWESLASFPDEWSTNPLVADDQAVYWATDQYLRAWSKSDRTVRTIAFLELQPDVLAVSGEQLLLASGYVLAIDKATTFDPLHPDPAGKAIFPAGLFDPAVIALTADAENVYLATQIEVAAVHLADGVITTLAERDPPPGQFFGLVIDPVTQQLEFTDSHQYPMAATAFSTELRAVPILTR
jgi:hypothetical protein